jgi:hypothetical protein
VSSAGPKPAGADLKVGATGIKGGSQVSLLASRKLVMADRRSNDQQGFVQRAKRFAVAIPIRYRRRKSAEWREGTTVNVSVSGILVRGSESSKPPATLDFALTLPTVASGKPGAEIRCRGTLVRKIEGAGHEETVFAVSIERYRIVRKRWDSEGGYQGDS